MKFWFALDNEKECDDLLEGINWRTQAQQRVYKYDESEIEKEPSGKADSAEKKDGKKHKKYYLARKREKRDKEKSSRVH